MMRPASRGLHRRRLRARRAGLRVGPRTSRSSSGSTRPELAEANAQSRVLSTAAKRQRLDLRSPTSRSYLDAVALSQTRFEARLAREVPGARRAPALPHHLQRARGRAPRRAAPAARDGSAKVYPSTTFRGELDRSVAMIGATSFWLAPGVDAGRRDEDRDPRRRARPVAPVLLPRRLRDARRASRRGRPRTRRGR